MKESITSSLHVKIMSKCVSPTPSYDSLRTKKGHSSLAKNDLFNGPKFYRQRATVPTGNFCINPQKIVWLAYLNTIEIRKLELKHLALNGLHFNFIPQRNNFEAIKWLNYALFLFLISKEDKGLRESIPHIGQIPIVIPLSYF